MPQWRKRPRTARQRKEWKVLAIDVSRSRPPIGPRARRAGVALRDESDPNEVLGARSRYFVKACRQGGGERRPDFAGNVI
jgi:hypothetical protein